MSVSVHFLHFLFKLKEVKPTSMSNEKYAENQISNSTSHQKKKKGQRGERSKKISNFKYINS